MPLFFRAPRWLIVNVVFIAWPLGTRAAEPQTPTPDELKAKAKSVLSQLEGDIALRGLKEPVEVLRDRHGVPHIYAKNQDDLFFAQGFVTAQDRLFQMDWWRRVAVGETAAVLGKAGLDGDRFAHLVRYRGDMDAEWTSYGPDAKQIATAFTNGINACIDHMGDRLPIEFQLLHYRPAKWKPEDCLGRMAGIIMIRNFTAEVARAELVATVGVEKARRLAPTDPPREYGPLPGLDLDGIDQSILAAYKAATGPLKLRLADADADGSNNWVVDGTLSASGKPMLASDPHRALALPSLRYLVHLNAPGWNVIGSGEPALPGVAIGHNERIAWGITIVGTDQSDLYVEETHADDPTQYRVGDRWEKMTVLRESVAVKGEPKPVELELRFTRHGPVLHQDTKRRRAYALKWVGAEPGAAGYLGSLALDRARNQEEFLTAIKAWKLPSENTVYADVDGNIGWVAAALTPVRNGWDGLLPVPGASGKYEWSGFLGVKDLPQAFNPPKHFIATANHNILPRDYPHAISYEWALGYRSERLHNLLASKRQFTLADFQAMQHDTLSLPGKRFAAVAAGLELPGDAAERPFLKSVAEWNGELDAGSQGGLIYSVWSQELVTEFFRLHVSRDNLLEFLRGGYGLEVMLSALEKPDRFWFGDDPAAARDRLLRTTLTAAMTKLHRLFPDGPLGQRWGALHTASFEHPLAQMGPAHAQAFNLGPVPRGGDGHTPLNARFDARFHQIHGASFRQVLDLADWDRGMATSVPGQSGQPGSPHYADLLPLWAEGRYFPLPFSRGKVEEMTRHRLLLKPAI
jgi:penicillin amidase